MKPNCRFTGHTSAHYSVAQHSVLVSHLAYPSEALAGLLHDAAEAFLGDVSAPLKQLLPDYKALERRIEPVIWARFGLPETLPQSVKDADRAMLATEQRDLMTAHEDAWEWELNPSIQPLRQKLQPWSAKRARKAFLDRFYALRRAA